MRILLSVLLALLALSLAAHGVDEGTEGNGIGEGKIFSNSWAVEISGGDEVAERIAKRHGFTNLGRVSAYLSIGAINVYM